MAQNQQQFQQSQINSQQQNSTISDDLLKKYNIDPNNKPSDELVRSTLAKYTRSTLGSPPPRQNFQQSSINTRERGPRSYTPNSYISGATTSNVQQVNHGEFWDSQIKKENIVRQLVSEQPPVQYQAQPVSQLSQYSYQKIENNDRDIAAQLQPSILQSTQSYTVQNKPKIVISQDGNSTVFGNEVTESKRYTMDAPEKTQVTTRVYQVDRSQSYVPTTFYKEPTPQQETPKRVTYIHNPTQQPSVIKYDPPQDQVVYKTPQVYTEPEDVKEDYAVCNIF